MAFFLKVSILQFHGVVPKDRDACRHRLVDLHGIGGIYRSYCTSPGVAYRFLGVHDRT